MWTALLLLVLEVIPCYLLSLRALPACSWPFKILFVACEPGASLPLMSFYTPLPHMLAFPSVSSDLVQCVLPCSLVPLQASSCLSPFPVLSFPFLCWGWGEGGGWTQGLTPPGHMATAESQPHFRLVFSTLSVLGLWLMTVFASLLKGPVWSSAVVSVALFPWVPKAHGPIHLNPCLDLVGTLLWRLCVFLGP